MGNQPICCERIAQDIQMFDFPKQWKVSLYTVLLSVKADFNLSIRQMYCIG